MDERRLDPRDINFDNGHDLNYDPRDPICDLMFDTSHLTQEVCLTNPVDDSLSYSDQSLGSLTGSPELTEQSVNESCIRNNESRSSLKAGNSYGANGCGDNLGTCGNKERPESKKLTLSQNQTNGSLHSNDKNNKWSTNKYKSKDKLEHHMQDETSDLCKDPSNKQQAVGSVGDISNSAKAYYDTQYIKCSNGSGPKSNDAPVYLSSDSQKQSCHNEGNSTDCKYTTISDKHIAYNCSQESDDSNQSETDNKDNSKFVFYETLLRNEEDLNDGNNCDTENICELCGTETTLPSTDPVNFSALDESMQNLTFHSIPNINYTVMEEETGSITGVSSELLIVRDQRVVDGQPPMDTVSLPPEIEDLRDWEDDGIQSMETNTVSVLCDQCNADPSATQPEAIRRTFSEPNIARQRRIQAYGLSRHSRQAWYRRTTRTNRASIAAFRFPSITEQSGFTLWNTTRQEKALLFCICLCNLCSMMCMSVMAPFFPGEAEEKGVNLMLSGWIFGVFALTEFFFAPICGKLVPVLGPEFMFLAGQFFSGSCYILFGLLEHVESSSENNTVYLILAFTLRIFTALGCSASITATFTITAVSFNDNVATVIGLIETSTGIGMSLGPALGGVLYDAGGFQLPFISLGAFMVIMVPVSKCMLPGQYRYNLSSTLIGLIFLLIAGCYGIFCPILGVVCDHIEDTSPMLVIGLILSGLGTMLLGPSPHLGFPLGYNVLWLNLIALIVLGFALSLAIVPTFDRILDAADKAGFEDNIEMYGVVAGLWASCYAFGDFVGPSLGGFLSEHYSFPWCMTYIGYACWAVDDEVYNFKTSIFNTWYTQEGVMYSLLWLYERYWGPTQVCGCCGREQRRKDKIAKVNEYERVLDADKDTDDESEPLLQDNRIETIGNIA